MSFLGQMGDHERRNHFPKSPGFWPVWGGLEGQVEQYLRCRSQDPQIREHHETRRVPNGSTSHETGEILKYVIQMEMLFKSFIF